ncbi:MAG: DUF4363 family protein [Clostridia bacterium]|nr:DUF4363 family protein [Clostridia bacterium]MDE7214823.1 DUF4363 family protein [Clostridia bacterium]
MVKAICYTLAAILLCAGLFIFSEWYLGNQFNEFSVALETLYAKIEDETATRDDGYAVRAVWEDKKSKLHMLVPHNDISYIDYWLNEACSLIYTKNYDLALGNVEVLKQIAKNLPDAYRLKWENIL